MDGETKIYGVIGDPIGHSLSPTIHNVAFRKLGLNAIYLAFQVKSENLVRAVEGFKALNIQGFNVTIPHKTSIMSLLDKVDPLAEKIGAVNTVKNVDGKLFGYNTDGLGALQALKKSKVKLDNKKIVLIGAGGAGKALAFTFANYAKEMVILNRTEEKAVKLSKTISENFSLQVKGLKLTQENLKNELKNADLLVNATSLGMYPNVDETPVDKNLINQNLVVFDVVYNPLKTRFLKEAEEKGAKIVNGLSMLIYQAVEAFKIWTGLNPPVKTMFKVALKELKHGK
ncbi:shikimate dehydrogenase [Candidatus Bathyarchaeota archaeon]|nr:MAG: shikimate dehydrogenase [Candidatus Bathyarchaeota archaeon]